VAFCRYQRYMGKQGPKDPWWHANMGLDLF
jgi:hypothetical protein